jgi:hypothetical protein
MIFSAPSRVSLPLPEAWLWLAMFGFVESQIFEAGLRAFIFVF